MANQKRRMRDEDQADALVNAPVDLPGFAGIKTAVAQQFARMSAHDLFRTGAEKDALWETYLGSFPDGSNPIFRKRSEHDCSCCRQFVRAVGNVVAVIDGELTSVWDITVANPAYQAVADAMAAAAKAHAIDNYFLHTEGKVGTDRNYEDDDGAVRTWEHFFAPIPNSRVCSKKDIGPKLSETRAQHDVLLRSLMELKLDAVDTVLELIAQNSLYRGEEHRHAVSAFRQVKVAFDALTDGDRDAFVWSKISTLPGSVSKIRNTSIGQLLTDLSEDRDMESAVKAFEAMVAPTNYKRPTALVTKAMVEKARATVEDLGLTSALDRRYATLTDITVNNILFADRTAKRAMTGGVFDDIATVSAKPKTFDKVEEIGIEKFLADIVPKAESIEVLVENRHAGNLVSLIAPADPTAKQMFKWDNRFSWSYQGDFTDSIKERVKKAGGNVAGDLCCRLAWFNHDDLDFHMHEGPASYEIYYGNRGSKSPSGGQLDVDMNAGGGYTREPVENIFYETSSRMTEAVYTLYVHQYARRESTNIGFEAEIDWKGTIHRFVYDKAVKPGEKIIVAGLRYTKATGIEIISSLPATTASKRVWNLDTENFHKANVVMLSPNHWDGHGVGNKHYFFMLSGCQNDGTARGFYNEFLKGELDGHRKVFEMVGARMRANESVNQLSGLGFSSTQRNHAIVRVKGAFSRTLKVTF